MRSWACLLRLLRRPSPSPPPSCLAACSRARCHAGRVADPARVGPPLLRHRSWPPTRPGPLPRAPGLGGTARVGCADCVLPSPRIRGTRPSLLLWAFSRGRMPECRIATAQRRWDPAPVVACLVGVRCWGRHCRMRIAGCVHRGTRTASHGGRSGPWAGAPERHCAAQPGTGASRRGPRRSMQVGRGSRLRSAVGSESQSGSPLHGLAWDRHQSPRAQPAPADGAG